MNWKLSIVLMAFALVAQDTDNGVYKIGPGITPPQLISKTEPIYTDEAQKAGVNSTAVISLILEKDGTPSNLQIVKSPGFGLDEKATEAVATWRFQPATKDGQPIRTVAKVEVNWRLLSHNVGQLDRLNFNVPAIRRPQIVKGKMPSNPKGSTRAYVRIALSVTTEGKPTDVKLIDASNDKWAEQTIREIDSWRFQPVGQQVDGILELTLGNMTPPALPGAQDKR